MVVEGYVCARYGYGPWHLRGLQLGICSSEDETRNIWPRGPASVMVPLNGITLKAGETYQFSPVTVTVLLPEEPLPRVNWLCSQLWEAKGFYPARDFGARPLVPSEATPASGAVQPIARNRPTNVPNGGRFDPRTVLVGRRALDFKLRSLDGEQIQLSNSQRQSRADRVLG